MKRILVATDGSEGAARAVGFAAGLAAETGARLTIVNVIAGGDLPDSVLSQFMRPQNQWLRDTLAAESAETLRQARDRARQRGAPEIQLESREGSPAQAILDVAAEIGADAIVVGKRGAGRVSGLLIGSVSQKLASLSDRVVMVTP